ncbi:MULTISPECIES: NlpC/P60 family protein [Protofrankia]|uniref:NLP/P60 protein n=1 Tax=Candidatus Protofrankia datiscae TaxID=2716812 RepID=F8B1R9_9ACTN|nr:MULTISPECIES: C40 family peptidase [Protofrankia]AEH07675.1 NLP/P60 protein [Candidatus Protofrankia datiscae]
MFGRLPGALGLISILAGGIILLPGAATSARADDIDTINRDIAAAQQQLTELTHSTEAATEAFNAGRLRLSAAEQAVSTATENVRRAGNAVRAAADRRRALGSATYRSGGLEQLSVLFSGDPGTALDRVGAMDSLARRGRAAEIELRSARHDLTGAQAAAQEALAERQRETASLEERKKRIEASVTAQRALLDDLVARHAELVRQAHAREEAARRAGELAAAAAAQAQARAAAAERDQLRSRSDLIGSTSLGSTGTSVAPARPPAIGSGGAVVAVAQARAQLGKPYVWGAAGPDAFDCSGLTQWVWAKAGVALSHFTGAQWNEGRRVSRGELIPGDLVFFGEDLHHVGIYVGNGSMIDAPRTGTVIRLEPVWWETYAGAVRPGA